MIDCEPVREDPAPVTLVFVEPPEVTPLVPTVVPLVELACPVSEPTVAVVPIVAVLAFGVEVVAETVPDDELLVPPLTELPVAAPEVPPGNVPWVPALLVPKTNWALLGAIVETVTAATTDPHVSPKSKNLSDIIIIFILNFEN